jgi:hypothetical protein
MHYCGPQKDKINPITLNERAMFCPFFHENCQVFGGFEMTRTGCSFFDFFFFQKQPNPTVLYINLF